MTSEFLFCFIESKESRKEGIRNFRHVPHNPYPLEYPLVCFGAVEMSRERSEESGPWSRVPRFRGLGYQSGGNEEVNSGIRSVNSRENQNDRGEEGISLYSPTHSPNRSVQFSSNHDAPRPYNSYPEQGLQEDNFPRRANIPN